MEVAPVLVLQALYPADRGYAPVLGHLRVPESKKKGPERWVFGQSPAPLRGRKEKTCRARDEWVRPRSPCIITIIPVRCKEKQLRLGREG